MTVRPRRASCDSVSRRRYDVKASRPDVGSSRISMLGRVTRTQPIDNRLTSHQEVLTRYLNETHLFSPPDIPFLNGPPTTVSAASRKPSSSIVCSTIKVIASSDNRQGRKTSNVFSYIGQCFSNYATCSAHRSRICDSITHRSSILPGNPAASQTLYAFSLALSLISSLS